MITRKIKNLTSRKVLLVILPGVLFILLLYTLWKYPPYEEPVTDLLREGSRVKRVKGFATQREQQTQTKQEQALHIAIIPHFMLNSQKVDEFYAFLKQERYGSP